MEKKLNLRPEPSIYPEELTNLELEYLGKYIDSNVLDVYII